MASFKEIAAALPEIQGAVTQHAMSDMANIAGAQPTQGKGLFAQVLSEMANSDIVQDIGAELGRLGVQGQAELGGALFNGNAYVPYGEGQKAVEAPEQQKEIERGMER